MENKFWKKIWAKRESGLTAVRLKMDPPVIQHGRGGLQLHCVAGTLLYCMHRFIGLIL